MGSGSGSDGSDDPGYDRVCTPNPGCSVGGADVYSTLAGVGVFGLGYVALGIGRRRSLRK